MASLKVFLSLLLFSPIIFAEDFSNQKEVFHIEMQKNIHVSADCLKKADCLALKSLTEKIKDSPPQNGLLGHPASRFCKDAGGLNIILKSKKNQAFDFCQFKDLSLIDSWDLYYHHHKR